MEVKAEFDWSTRCGNLSGMYNVLKRTERILNELTPENFDLLKYQLIALNITSASILEGVASLVFEKALSNPKFCSLCGRLCSFLHKELPRFPDGDDGKEFSFRKLLINRCQKVFEGFDEPSEELGQVVLPIQETRHEEKERLVKRRFVGNVRLIIELFNQNILPEKIIHHIFQVLLRDDITDSPAEEKVEAICMLYSSLGKQFDASPNSRIFNEICHWRLKELSENPILEPQLCTMVRDVIDLRVNNWDCKHRENTRVGTRSESEEYLGLCVDYNDVDNDNDDSDEKDERPESLLNKYFDALTLMEKSKFEIEGDWFVKRTISTGLAKGCVGAVVKLVQHLFEGKVITSWGIENGCLQYATDLEGQEEADQFGEIIGSLVLSGALDLKVIHKFLRAPENVGLQEALKHAILRTVTVGL